MDTRAFESLTSMIRARDLLEPLGPPLTKSTDLDTANDALQEDWEDSGFAYPYGDRASLVFEDDHVVGWYSIGMLDSDKQCVGDVCEQIHPSEIVTADTSAFKLVQLLPARPRSGIILFVLDDAAIVGTVSVRSLQSSPLFRLCLFSLTLELEETALQAALVEPLESWNALSDDRRAIAQRTMDRLSGRKAPPPSRDHQPLRSLLSATLFIDKGSIAAKRRLLADRKPRAVMSLFAKAEKVRNWCAHTRDSGSLWSFGEESTEIASFTGECSRVITELRGIAERDSD